MLRRVLWWCTPLFLNKLSLEASTGYLVKMRICRNLSNRLLSLRSACEDLSVPDEAEKFSDLCPTDFFVAVTVISHEPEDIALEL